MPIKSRVTIKDVAKAAEVSVATVSYVINNISNMVSEDTRNRVLKVIDDLGYVPNLTARSLVKNESRVIGVIMPSKGYYKQLVLRENPFYLEFISGIEDEALEHGYSTSILGVEDEKECRVMLNSQNYAGFITFDFINKEVFNLLKATDRPIVVIDKEVEDTENVCYLNVDNERGSFLAVEHLINLGHKKIGYYTFALGSQVARERLSGFKKVHLENGIMLDEEKTIFIDNMEKVVEAIVNKEITAVFCSSDLMAMNLLRALHKSGVRVPDEASIIGFDDIAFCQFLIPALTTIKQNIFNKGEKAVEIILNNIDSSKEKIKEYVMDVELIERESVKNL
jgi:LacI family transcriptional regulator